MSDEMAIPLKVQPTKVAQFIGAFLELKAASDPHSADRPVVS